jgi:hypothetical protein
VRALTAGSALDVLRCGLAPAWARLATVEGSELLAVEHIQHRAGQARQALEVAHGGRVVVDAADAAEARLHLADAGLAAVEAARTTA